MRKKYYFVALTVGLFLSLIFPNFDGQGNSKANNYQPVYLSNLTPQKTKVGWGKLRNDITIGGQEKIKLKYKGSEKTYNKGVAAHADAEIIYDLSIPKSKGKNVFSSLIGIQAGKWAGDVKFKFYVDDNLVYTSPKINHNTTLPVIIPIKNADKLKIEIDDLGSASQDHSVLADAKFITQDTTNFVDYQALVDKLNQNFDFAEVSTNQQNRLTMLQLQFLDKIQPMNYNKFISENLDAEFIKWLFNDAEALDYISQMEQPTNGIGFLEVLKNIYQQDSTIKINSKNKLLAIAVANKYSNGGTFWIDSEQPINPVGRYQIYRNLARIDGALMPSFDQLDPALVANVISAPITNQDLLYLRERIKNEHPELLNNNQTMAQATYKFIGYSPHNPFGDSVQGPHYYGVNPDLARMIEYGAVCGGVSMFDASALRAFGVPSRLVGQPGHAAVIYLKQDNNWSGANWINNWDQTNGRIWTPALSKTKDSHFSAMATILGTDAIKNPNYDQARELYNYTKYLNNSSLKKAIYSKSLEDNPLFTPAYADLIDQMIAENANQYQYLTISQKIMDNFYNYPIVMQDLLDRIEPKLTNRAILNDYYIKYLETMARSERPNVKAFLKQDGKYNQKYFKDRIAKAKRFFGQFNFSGENANKLVGIQTDSEYSLDNGQTFLPVKEDNHQLTTQEIESINPQFGIKVRIRGAKLSYMIKFLTQAAPNLKINDQQNFIIGVNNQMEYSFDQQNWFDYQLIKPDLSGAKTIFVRYKKHDATYASDSVRLQFSANQTDDFNLILKDNIEIIDFSSDQAGAGDAVQNIIDGDENTIWHSNYNQGDQKFEITFKFNKKYPIKSVNYLPRQNGSNGKARKIKLFYGETKACANELPEFVLTDEQFAAHNLIKIPVDINTQYLKFKISEGENKFGSAAELQFETTKAEAQAALNQQNDIKEQQNRQKLKQYLNEKLTPKIQTLMVSHPNQIAEVVTLSAKINNQTSNQELIKIIQQIDSKIKQIENQNIIDKYAKINPQTETYNYDNLIQKTRNDYIQAFYQQLTKPMSQSYQKMAIAFYNYQLLSTKDRLAMARDTMGVTMIFGQKRRANAQKIADQFKQQFAGLLASQDPDYLNQNITKALLAYQILPARSRQLLRTEFNQLNQKNILAKTATKIGQQNLMQMITQSENAYQNSDLTEQEKTSLKEVIDQAKLVQNNQNSTKNQLYQQIYNLMMAEQQILYRQKTENLVNKRVKKFRQKHQQILNKDVKDIAAADQDLINAANWSYIRSGAAAINILRNDKQKLDLAQKIINDPEYLAQQLAEEKVDQEAEKAEQKAEEAKQQKILVDEKNKKAKQNLTKIKQTQTTKIAVSQQESVNQEVSQSTDSVETDSEQSDAATKTIDETKNKLKKTTKTQQSDHKVSKKDNLRLKLYIGLIIVALISSVTTVKIIAKNR